MLTLQMLHALVASTIVLVPALCKAETVAVAMALQGGHDAHVTFHMLLVLLTSKRPKHSNSSPVQAQGSSNSSGGSGGTTGQVQCLQYMLMIFGHLSQQCSISCPMQAQGSCSSSGSSGGTTGQV